MSEARNTGLVEFSFASKFARDASPAVISRMVRQSWREHTESDVTGFLRIAGDRVEQTLEGPSDVVLRFATGVLTDRRYGWIKIVAFGPIGARRHSGWTVEGFSPQGARADVNPAVVAVDFSEGRDPASPGLRPAAAAART